MEMSTAVDSKRIAQELLGIIAEAAQAADPGQTGFPNYAIESGHLVGRLRGLARQLETPEVLRPDLCYPQVTEV